MRNITACYLLFQVNMKETNVLVKTRAVCLELVIQTNVLGGKICLQVLSKAVKSLHSLLSGATRTRTISL